MAVPYDHPNTLVQREYFAASVGAASATDYAPFRSFQKIQLIAVHHVVTVSATDTARTFQVVDSGTVVASVTIGTSSIGTETSQTLNRQVGSLTELTVRWSDGAVGTGDIIYEYLVEHGATLTART